MKTANVYPIDRSRKGGAKPRKIEERRAKGAVCENNGRTIERPVKSTSEWSDIIFNILGMRLSVFNYAKPNNKR